MVNSLTKAGDRNFLSIDNVLFDVAKQCLITTSTRSSDFFMHVRRHYNKMADEQAHRATHGYGGYDHRHKNTRGGVSMKSHFVRVHFDGSCKDREREDATFRIGCGLTLEAVSRLETTDEKKSRNSYAQPQWHFVHRSFVRLGREEKADASVAEKAGALFACACLIECCMHAHVNFSPYGSPYCTNVLTSSLMRAVDEILKQLGVCAPVLFGDLKVRM